jgi:DNA-binding IclR family transcriptional regulator
MARKLLSVIVKEAYNGPIRSKPAGVATPAEILEACGIDVGEFYSLLVSLTELGLIRVSGDYPFEEIRLTGGAFAAQQIAKYCIASGTPIDEVLARLDADRRPGD